jgi:hypothetical protein
MFQSVMTCNNYSDKSIGFYAQSLHVYEYY